VKIAWRLWAACTAVFARILVVPASRDGLGPFYRDVIAVNPLEPWDAASAAYLPQTPPRGTPPGRIGP
jgi:hypothetical protein